MPTKKTDPPVVEPTPAPTAVAAGVATGMALPYLPRVGSVAIESATVEGDRVAVAVAYRVVTAGKPDTEKKERLQIPLTDLPDLETTSVDALEGALIAAVQQRLAPDQAASSPAAPETALDSALTRLAQRRVVSLT